VGKWVVGANPEVTAIVETLKEIFQKTYITEKITKRKFDK
jgi:hypothetical protein